nr:MAG TPA: hypothetical protein [Caudoviricetes sp.]
MLCQKKMVLSTFLSTVRHALVGLLWGLCSVSRS